MSAEPKESRLVSFSIWFHDYVNTLTKLTYHSIIPPKMDVPLETAQSNIDTFTKKVIEDTEKINGDLYSFGLYEQKKPKAKSLEKRLETFGDYYIPTENLKNKRKSSLLWKTALEYDLKGIIPKPSETLEDFVYRGNTLLFIHKKLKKNYGEPKIEVKNLIDVKLSINPYYETTKFVKPEDIEEANRRIPYFMDLSWVAVYVKEKKDFIVPALGITFTFPQYNGFNFVQMLSEYKSREQFVSVLAHEMTHAGTVYFDTKRKFLETKAYSVGKGDMILGEYAVAFNAGTGFLIGIIKKIVENYMFIPLPDKYIKILPKIKSAIEILDNTGSYREVERNLKELYDLKGGYILGRLNADEMEEFRDTNNIPARIAMKEDLKWKIMKTNFAKL